MINQGASTAVHLPRDRRRNISRGIWITASLASLFLKIHRPLRSGSLRLDDGFRCPNPSNPPSNIALIVPRFRSDRRPAIAGFLCLVPIRAWLPLPQFGRCPRPGWRFRLFVNTPPEFRWFGFGNDLCGGAPTCSLSSSGQLFDLIRWIFAEKLDFSSIEFLLFLRGWSSRFSR